MGFITEKKNITIAFDIEDYSYLEQLKEENSMKSFTQTFLFILDFYRDHYDTIMHLKDQEMALDEQIVQLQQEIKRLRENMGDKKELDYIKQNIDLLMQKQDLIEPIMTQLSNKVNKEEMDVIKEQLSSMTNIIEALVERRLEEGDAALKENQTIKALLKAKKNLKQ